MSRLEAPRDWVVIGLVMCACAMAGIAGTLTYTTAGTHQLSFPAGVAIANGVLTGGGGRGAKGSKTAGGGGAGGGETCISDVRVLAGEVYTVVVGAGGDENRGSGLATTWGGTVIVANGGVGNTANQSTGMAGGTGGTGDTCYSGGAGATQSAGVGGGGGGSGGTEEKGNTATSQLGADEVTGGGPGGTGGAIGATGSPPATGPGGGGGGGGLLSGGSAGGSGFAGQAIITWDDPVNAVMPVF